MINVSDPESGIKEIEYSINGDIEIEKYNPDETLSSEGINIEKVFENLKSNEEYTIVITILNGNNTKTSKEIITATSDLGSVEVVLSGEPDTAWNGYLKKQIATIEYSGGITSPYYYVKTTRAATSNVATTYLCGTSSSPGTCSSITSRTSLVANTWYRFTSNPTITYDTAASSTGTIYVAVGDGTDISSPASGTLSKIELTAPTVTLGTATVTTKSVSIPITYSDAGAGAKAPVCRYSTTSGSYTTSGTVKTISGSTTCTISNATAGSTYYYQVCVTDAIGNGPTCQTGSAKTSSMGTASVSLTNTPTTAKNGYLYTQTATIAYSGSTISSPYYYVKSTRIGISDVAATYSCGTGTSPGTCSSITSTRDVAVNTWYRYSSVPTISYKVSSDTTSTIYVAVGDGTNITTTASGTISKIDKTQPTVTLSNKDITTNSSSVVIGYSVSDSQSGIGSVTCHYGNVGSDGAGTATGLVKNKYYPYVICATDNVGNTTTCQMGIIHYEAATYTVTFDAHAGTSSVSSQTYTDGDALGTLPTATLSGYTFAGWYTSGGTKVTTSTTVTSNQTLYARFEGTNKLAGASVYKQYYYINSSGTETLDGNSMWSIFYVQVPAGTYYIQGQTGGSPRAKLGSTLVSNPATDYKFTATTTIYMSVVDDWAPTKIESNGYTSGGYGPYIVKEVIRGY